MVMVELTPPSLWPRWKLTTEHNECHKKKETRIRADISKANLVLPHTSAGLILPRGRGVFLVRVLVNFLHSLSLFVRVLAVFLLPLLLAHELVTPLAW